MFEKLVTDSMVTWTEAYKIDGFRMDLMEHLMKSSVEKALVAIQAVRPDAWIFGEGWNFGEVKDNARGINATQFNMAGTPVSAPSMTVCVTACVVAVHLMVARTWSPTWALPAAGSRFDTALNNRMDLIRIGMR